MRVLNRLFGLGLGLALAGAGFFMAVETILAAMGHRFAVIPGKSWLRALRHTPWSATTVILVFALVVGGGFLLLIVELRRWRRPRTPVTVAGGAGDWWVVRRSVEAHLARRIETETPAGHPRTKITPRDRRWRVRVVVREPPDLVSNAAPTVGPASTVGPVAAVGLAGSGRQALASRVEEVTLEGLRRLGAPEDSRVKVRMLSPRKVKAEAASGERRAT